MKDSVVEAGAEAVEQVAFFLLCCMSLAQCHGDRRPQQQPWPAQSKGGSLDKSQLKGEGTLQDPWKWNWGGGGGVTVSESRLTESLLPALVGNLIGSVWKPSRKRASN